MQTGFGPVCLEHLEFMRWADNAMFSAVAQLSSDQTRRDQGNSFASLFDTLNHIYLAELVWLKRVSVSPHAMLGDEALLPDMPALGEAFPRLHGEWLAWAESLSAEDWIRPLALTTRLYGALVLPRWQIVFHVVNHGSYHRGQIATMLRQSGIKPPSTDLTLFYRSRQ